jgi:hypothetical protein
MTKAPMKTAPGAIEAVRVLDMAPMVRNTIDPATKLTNANR